MHAQSINHVFDAIKCVVQQGFTWSSLWNILRQRTVFVFRQFLFFCSKCWETSEVSENRGWDEICPILLSSINVARDIFSSRRIHIDYLPTFECVCVLEREKERKRERENERERETMCGCACGWLHVCECVLVCIKFASVGVLIGGFF